MIAYKPIYWNLRHEPRRYSSSQAVPAASQSLLDVVGLAEAEEASAVQVRDSDACSQEVQRPQKEDPTNKLRPKHPATAVRSLGLCSPCPGGPSRATLLPQGAKLEVGQLPDLGSFEPQLSKESCLRKYREASQLIVGAGMRGGKQIEPQAYNPQYRTLLDYRDCNSKAMTRYRRTIRVLSWVLPRGGCPRNLCRPSLHKL